MLKHNEEIISQLTHSMDTILLEKLIVSELVNKFPTFYGTQMFITAFTRAHHLSVAGTKWVQSTSFNSVS
jgi:hypothetical protein